MLPMVLFNFPLALNNLQANPLRSDRMTQPSQNGLRGQKCTGLFPHHAIDLQDIVTFKHRPAEKREN